MSAAARPIHRPIEEETLVSSAHVHDLIAENADLRRELRVARDRNSTFIRAMNELHAPKATSLQTARGEAPVARVLSLAQFCEAQGHVAVVRFARDEQARIIGIELAVMKSATNDRSAEVSADTLTLGMGVVDGDEEMSA
jgi:hypothetical protein